MKYYKVFYWLNKDFTFDIVECNENVGEDEEHAIFSLTEYFRSLKKLHLLKISHARLYFIDP